jgi:hypothetical protein
MTALTTQALTAAEAHLPRKFGVGLGDRSVFHCHFIFVHVYHCLLLCL